MVRPRIVTHALVSADGRLEGFTADVGLYYAVAGRLDHDGILAGSGTMVAAAQAAGIDLSAPEDDAAALAPASIETSLPLMVIVDSRGRMTRFDWLRATGLWRDVLVLGSGRTPAEHRERLHTAGVELDTFGDDNVDLHAALEALGDRGITTMRVDAGPTLNTVLWGAGLIDEVSLLVAPYLVGHGRCLLDEPAAGEASGLTLSSAEPQPDGHVWLRYTVSRG